MTDVFHDWKDKKIVVIDADLLDDTAGIMILLTDLSYWVNRTDDIISWCKENNCTQSGLTITLPSEKELLLFYLKWC